MLSVLLTNAVELLMLLDLGQEIVKRSSADPRSSQGAHWWSGEVRKTTRDAQRSSIGLRLLR